MEKEIFEEIENEYKETDIDEGDIWSRSDLVDDLTEEELLKEI